MATIGNDIKEAAKLLMNNNVVAFPTETVYGLGALASSESAIKKIFQIKKRPLFNPLILHVKDINSVYHVCEDIAPLATNLFETFIGNPLTIILKKKRLSLT